MLSPVAEGVFVHRSELLQNNTVVVEGGHGVLVVDAGITGTEMRCLAADLRQRALAVTVGFSTHPDWDHVLWHPDLGDVPRHGTALCAAAMHEFRSDPDWRARAAEALPSEIAEEVPLELFGLVTALPVDTVHLPWDGPAVRVLEHPAHSPGHAALLIEGPGVLAAGDMLSDLFIPMLDDVSSAEDPIEGYLLGLRVLESVADDVAVLVPGHGSVAGVDEVRRRIALDRAYVEALRDGSAHADPRIGHSARPGWEWVDDIHAGQLLSLTRRGRLER